VPDVPTLGETIPGLEVDAWVGIGVPAGTPADVVERLNRDINLSLADANLTKRYADVGAVPLKLSPAQAQARVAADLQKWRKVVEQAGLKPE
jgi:tripartite-type tricarboxylate transporter receptor subunit TctC